MNAIDPVVLVELIELRADVKRLAELVHEINRTAQAPNKGVDDWQLHENAVDPVSTGDRAVDIANRIKRRQQLGFN